MNNVVIAYWIQVVVGFKMLLSFFGFFMFVFGFIFSAIMYLCGTTDEENKFMKICFIVGVVGVIMFIMSLFVPSQELLHEMIALRNM